MISLSDKRTKELINGLRPCWTALRTEKRDFSGIKGGQFTCASVLLVGQPSMLCGIESTDLPGDRCEYFHVRCDIVDDQIYEREDVTLAVNDGSSEFDRKLQWLFETPALALTESAEEFRDGIRPDARRYKYSFYNGLLISDPKGRGSLRLTASNMADFIVTGEFTFGPEAA